MSKKYELVVHGSFYQGDSFQSRKIQAEAGENLLLVLKKNGLYETDCSGNGSCGKCRVRFRTSPPLPVGAEREHLTPQELREGVRLACRHSIKENAILELQSEPGRLPDIVMSAPVTVTADCKKNEAGTVYAAIDVGTTTIAMQAYNRQGEVLATYSALNPQRRYGADVMSRITAALEGQLKEQQRLILECLEQGLSSLSEHAGRLIAYAIIAGNTTMISLLRGQDVRMLAQYPFEPVDINSYKMWIAGIPAYTIPGISAFVGGDIVAGIQNVSLHKKNDLQMLVDLGTNGEIVLGNAEKVLATATAAGPAFEGTISSQMMGSDLIGLTAELLEQGIVDETGCMREPYFSTGIDIDGVHLIQEDIRALQKAKAAVAVGIELLLEQYGAAPEDISQVWLAGGFGYYLDTESAVRIGMLPRELSARITAAGNTALAGAALIGAQLSEQSDSDILTQLEAFAAKCQVMNLAEQSGFEEKYILHLNFPA